MGLCVECRHSALRRIIDPKMIRRRTVCALAVVLLVSMPATAQRYAIRNLTPEDGLPSSQIFALYQDAKGYLWTGSPGGLSRYDGIGFTTFSRAHGLENQSIKVILSDRAGNLWLGTNNGVAVFDGRRFQHYGPGSGIGAGRVTSALADRYGTIWFGTQEGGLSAFVHGHFITYTQASGLPANNVLALFADSRGRLWIGTNKGGIAVAALEPDGKLRDIHLFSKSDGLPHDTVRAFAEDRWGNVYIGTRGGGLARFDGKTFQTFDKRMGLSGNDVDALLIDRRGELVIGTYDRGITICDLPSMSTCRTITTDNGLQNDTVLSLMEDADATLWIGMDYGVSQLVSEKFATFADREGYADSVFSLYADTDGSMWLGRAHGVSHLRFDSHTGKVEWNRHHECAELEPYEVWDIVRDHRGQLWIGTSGGVCMYANGRCSRFLTTKEGLADNSVLDLYEDSDGRLWAGTRGGVSVLPPGSAMCSSYTRKDGLPADSVYAITQDHDGRMWFGTYAGLAVLERGTFRAFGKADGLRSDAIYSLHTARDGSVWMATMGGGVSRYSRSPGGAAQFLHFGPASGIESELAWAIRDDGRGHLCLGTNRGVYLLDTSKAVRDDAPGIVMRHYEKKDGLSDREISTHNAIAVDTAGNSWFGFSRGATCYRPEFDYPATANPRVDLVQVSVEHGPRLQGLFSAAVTQQPIQWLSDAVPTLPHDRNNIRFDFRGLTFASTQPMQYQTWLAAADQNHDQRWSPDTEAPFKEYTNLDPGRDLLRVRSRIDGGPWSASPAEYRFVIQPPFWQTWWARVAGLTLLALIIISIHRLRLRQINRRNRELQTMVDTRTDEIKRYSSKVEQHAREMEEANRRIVEADRAKSHFLAMMSHELRTPLNSIIGFSEILGKRWEPRAETREMVFLQNISDSGRHLLDLINSLLDLSKIEAGRMEVHVDAVALDELVANVCKVIGGIATRRGIEIHAEVPAELPVIEADGAKIKQILYNLLSNAVKFSSDHGRVDVRVRPLDEERSPLGVPSFEMSVTDRGPGIAPAELEVIFEEFRQTKQGSVYSGSTGLGLAIVRKLAEIQGGSAAARSSIGEGSTFVVDLPLRVASRLMAQTPASSGSEPGRMILIVEDDEEFRAALAKRLEEHGYRTAHATNGERVHQMVRELRPSVVTLDVLLPGLDGWSVLEELKNDPECAGVPVVVISIAANRDLGLALGADEVFIKPLDHESLLRCIQRLIPDPEPVQSVLVIDDDPNVHEILRSAFIPRGYEVVSADRGQLGIELAIAIHPSIIVLDLMMPGINGFEVAAKLRENEATAAIPLVVLTAKDLTQAERDQLEGKIRAVISKSVAPDAIVDAIRTLDRRRVDSGS